MPLFRQSQIQKNTPKTIKLTSLYKHLTGVSDLSQSDKVNILKALEMSGHDYTSASKILSGKELDISKAKELASHLSKVGLKGFAKNDTNKLVDKYVRSEAIKRKNISGRRREFMMESLQEDIYKAKTPRLKYSKNTLGATPKGGSSSKVKLGF